MANKTIGELTAASSVDGTELLEIEQSGSSKRATAAQIVALGGGGTGTVDTTGTPAANQIPIWIDANTLKGTTGITADTSSNVVANNFNAGYATHAPVSGNTILTVASPYQQYFSGGTQTCRLPVASTLVLGHRFFIANTNLTGEGILTVVSSGSDTVVTLAEGASALATCILASGTSAASWSVVTAGAGGGSGDAVTTDGLDQFAATTSAELRGVISDETGTGALVFNNAPTLTDPVITASAGPAASSTNFWRGDNTWAAPASASVSDTAYDATTWDGVTTVAPSKNAVRDKIEAIVLGGGAGDALTTNPLSQFAATTSAQLAGIMTNETGTGSLVFATGPSIGAATLSSPTLTTPTLGTPLSGTLSACTVDGTNLLGYRGIPQNSQTAAYTTVLSDAGKSIFHPSSDNNARTFTIDSNANVAFPIGTVIEFVNMAATASTIAITSDTMTLLPNGTTGSRTLAQYGRANAEKITSTAWIISGNSALS